MVNYPRHIKQVRRNQYVVTVLTVWFLLVMIFFTWLGVWQYQYRREFNDFRAKLETQVIEAKTTFAGLRDAYDPAASSQALMQLSEHLGSLKQPAQPGIFGLPAIRHRQAELLARTLPELRANLEATARVVEYQQKVSLKLQLLGLRTAGNEAQIRQLAELWQQTITEIQAITPPAELNGIHQMLTQRLGAVQGILVDLADFYKADNRAGFAAKYAELGREIEAFKMLAAGVKATAVQLDEYRALLLKAVYDSL